MKTTEQLIADAAEHMTARNAAAAEQRAMFLAERILELTQQLDEAKAELRALSYKEVKTLDLGL